MVTSREDAEDAKDAKSLRERIKIFSYLPKLFTSFPSGAKNVLPINTRGTRKTDRKTKVRSQKNLLFSW